MKMYEALGLQTLYSDLKTKTMPLKLAYKFTKVMKAVESEMGFYKNEFQKIIDEFAEKNSEGNYVYTDEGNSIKIIPGKESECQDRIAELQNLEIDIGKPCFTIDELDGLMLNMEQMSSLMPLIEE